MSDTLTSTTAEQEPVNADAQEPAQSVQDSGTVATDTLPADFGAALAAEFEKRTAQSAASTMTGDLADDLEASGAPAPDASTLEEGNPDPSTDTGSEVGVSVPVPVEGDGAPDPDQEPAGVSEPEAPTDDDPAPTGGAYIWREGDQEQAFTEEQVQQGLVLSSWANSLPVETRTAFAAIENGQAVAISRQDYEAFTAWQQSQRRTQRDADLVNLDLDPDALELLQKQRDEIERLRGGSPALGQSPQDQPQPAPGVNTDYLNANLDNTAAAMEAARVAYAAERGLSDEQVNGLIAHAVSANAFAAFAESLAVTNPATGQVIAPPDGGEVMRKALDFALVQTPQLHAQVTTPAAPAPATGPAPTPDPASGATNQDAGQAALTAKKARAASVSSAPSAAVTHTPRPVTEMSQQEQIDVMAADLAKALGRGTNE